MTSRLVALPALCCFVGLSAAQASLRPTTPYGAAGISSSRGADPDRRVQKCPAYPGGSGILTDGDFHDAPWPGGHTTFGKGQSFSKRWRVTKRTVDLSGSDFRLPYGVCSVDLDGSPGSGAIKHGSFPTTPSVTYTVTFLFSGNGICAPTVKTMSVSAAGQSETLTWDTSGGNNGENGDYLQESWTFLAVATSTTLVFQSLDEPQGKYYCGALVAAVSVTQGT